MKVTGYMIEADWDGDVLRVHGKNKAARVALAGEDHDTDVIVPRTQITGVNLKDASMLVNGSLRVSTTAGQTYKLHFRRKQSEDFHALAEALA